MEMSDSRAVRRSRVRRSIALRARTDSIAGRMVYSL
jgi:hypothetical protein